MEVAARQPSGTYNFVVAPRSIYKKICEPLAQKTAVVTSYEVISWHFLGVTEKNHEEHQ
jgi:hypothetical protein